MILYIFNNINHLFSHIFWNRYVLMDCIRGSPNNINSEVIFCMAWYHDTSYFRDVIFLLKGYACNSSHFVTFSRDLGPNNYFYSYVCCKDVYVYMCACTREGVSFTFFEMSGKIIIFRSKKFLWHLYLIFFASTNLYQG